MTMLRAVVGFGANLGDRAATMRSAADALARVARVEGRSHLYETAPVGPPQPAFLNAAMLVQFDGTPRQLLDALLAIEAGLGRVRGERWGPRTIDLDVLWIERCFVQSDDLTVPHPRLIDRAFALAPMLELVPGAVDPVSGEPYRIPGGDVHRLSDRI